MDRLSSVMCKARNNSALCSTKWDIEKMADDIDDGDDSHGSN